MVVDVHVLTQRALDLEGACDRMAEVAARAGIDRMVLLGDAASVGPRPSAEEIQAVNDLTRGWLARRPDQFLGFGYLCASLDPGFAASEFERCLEAGFQGFSLAEACGADDPIVDLAAERRLPIVLPVGASSPAQIAELARRRPELTILVTHLMPTGERGLADVCQRPNVLVDTSGGPPLAGWVDQAVHELGEDRVLFGSGAPRRDLAVQLEQVYGAYLTLRQERRVLGGNACRLLGLRETEP